MPEHLSHVDFGETRSERSFALVYSLWDVGAVVHLPPLLPTSAHPEPPVEIAPGGAAAHVENCRFWVLWGGFVPAARGRSGRVCL